MSRSWLVSVLVAALVAPVAAFAGTAAPPTASALANQTCKALQTSMGANFATTYHSFGACVSKTIQASRQQLQSAEKTCKTWQSDAAAFAASSVSGGKTFDQVFGSNGGKGKGAGANALGKCISQQAHALAAARVKATVGAGKQCRAALRADAAAFGTTYGTGKDAFAKCVAAKVAAAKTP
jgi:hypothetical protein